MIVPHSLILFDASAILTMIIMAYLSRRLGEALKVKPYYRILYITSVVVAISAVVETMSHDISIHVPQSVPMLFRLASACVAFFVCLRYWKWAFSEYLRK